MLPSDHHSSVQRALYLRSSGGPDGLPEVIELSKRPSNEMQRMPASAIGKLADFWLMREQLQPELFYPPFISQAGFQADGVFILLA